MSHGVIFHAMLTVISTECEARIRPWASIRLRCHQPAPDFKTGRHFALMLLP